MLEGEDSIEADPASTNVDDIFVLLAFFSDSKFRAQNVIIGQYAGIVSLFGLSLVASLLSLVIPRPYIGVFELFAIGLGVKKLLELMSSGPEADGDLEQHNAGASPTKTATVALFPLANGADNIRIYTPTFATHSGQQILVMGLVFASMTGLWCFFAHWLVNHPALGTPVRRYGNRAVERRSPTTPNNKRSKGEIHPQMHSL